VKRQRVRSAEYRARRATRRSLNAKRFLRRMIAAGVDVEAIIFETIGKMAADVTTKVGQFMKREEEIMLYVYGERAP